MDPGEKRDTAKTSITVATDSQKVFDLTTPNREDNPINTVPDVPVTDGDLP